MDISMIKDFIQPELLILIPVLYFIGLAIKKNEKIYSGNIPIILGVAGIVIAALWIVPNVEVFNAKNITLAIFAAITQGVLVAGVAVYVDQLIKQRKYKNDTTNIDSTAEIKVQPPGDTGSDKE